MASNTQDISSVSVDNHSRAAIGTFHAPVYLGNNENLNEVLNSLHTATDAPFNAFQRQHYPTCLPDTRVDLLQEIYNWADGRDGRCIFWLNGLAGTGKSTIARTVARRYFEKQRLGASFFFSRSGGDVGHAGKFVTSIAVQLAHKVPGLKRAICDVVADHGHIWSQSLRDQWCHLVIGPLSKLGENGRQSSYVLVVDALDECDNDNNIRTIIHLLAEARSLKAVRLRIFLTSRPEIPIRSEFCQLSNADLRDFVLHSISLSIIDHDISVFFKYNLELIRQEHSLDIGWPGEEIIRRLIQMARGLFIWAAIACRFIQEGLSADERVQILLEGSTFITAPEKHPEAHLNGLYTTVLNKSIRRGYSAKEKEALYGMLRHILGSIVVLFSPLSANSLHKLLNVTKQRVDQVLKDLHAILDISKVDVHPLHLHHPSFRDFLLDNKRCEDPNFWVDEKQAHQVLADRCIQLMSTSLKQDICGVDAPSMLVANVGRSRIEQSLLPEVQYACRYWIEHVRKSGDRLRDNGQVHCFLQEHLLHWLEALGWMGKVSEGVHAIAALESFVSSLECHLLSNFVHDARRFVLYSRSAIQQTPLQTYCSALVFAPTTSTIREQFKDCIPRYVRKLPEVKNTWDALLQILEGHSESVSAVAFSPDGRTLASASYDGTVRLWDAGTGEPLQTLNGHSYSVYAVAFSPKGKLLASASRDKTVRLWDAASGAALHTLEGHSDWVNSVAFSSDDKLLASTSNNGIVKLWDAESGAVRHTLEGNWFAATAVAFSSSSNLLAFASSGGSVLLWDASFRPAPRILSGHSDAATAVAFSPDGKLLASASNDKTVRLWDAELGAALRTFEGHFDSVSGVTFSPNGKLLASASRDGIVLLWDTSSGTTVKVLKASSSSIKGIAFSRDSKLLASASNDMLVRLWDIAYEPAFQMVNIPSDSVNTIAVSLDRKLMGLAWEDGYVKLWNVGSGTGVVLQTFEGCRCSVLALAFSPDSKLLASASKDGTVKLWDTASGTTLQTLKADLYVTATIVFSPESKLLALANWDGTVKIWDTSTGGLLQTLKANSYSVSAIAFSPKGKLLALASKKAIIIIWDVDTGEAVQTPKGHSDEVNALAFSPDGKLMASASSDRTVKLWDTGSGAVLQTLKGHLDRVNAVAFSPDGKLLVSASSDRTVKLWDTGSEATAQMLEDDSDWIDAVAFCPGGKILASASVRGLVKLWNAGSGAMLQTLNGHSGAVKGVAFSPDGKLLASASEDKTVMLWDANTGAAMHTLEGHLFTVSAFAFSLDGKLLVTVSYDTVILWDTGSGTGLQIRRGDRYNATAAVLSPDGTLLLSTFEGEIVRLRDASSGETLHWFQGHSDTVTAAAFSPDGKLLASASRDKTVRLWSVGSRTAIHSLDGHWDRVNAVAFSPDGKLLASASMDKTVRLWDANSGTALQTLRGHSFSVNAVDLSSDGKTLVSVCGDRTVRLWDYGSKIPLQTLEVDVVLRNLSFSSNGTFLRTDRGLLHTGLLSHSVSFSGPKPSHSIFVKEQWVVRGVDNILWLPPEHRPCSIAVFGGIVAFGYASGRFTTMEFAL